MHRAALLRAANWRQRLGQKRTALATEPAATLPLPVSHAVAYMPVSVCYPRVRVKSDTLVLWIVARQVFDQGFELRIVDLGLAGLRHRFAAVPH